MSEAPLFKQDEDLSGYFRTITWFNLLLAVQLFAGLTYAVLVDVAIQNFRYYLIPFIWITIGIMAVWHTEPVKRNTKHMALGAILAASYFLLILYLSGMIGPTTAAIEAATGFTPISVEWQHSLRWGPILIYSGRWLAATIIPYQIIGYLALTYLIYAAILDLSRSATAGIIGLAPCPGCAAPVLTSLLAGAAGTSSAFVVLIEYTYEIATVLFVGGVGLLNWQPTLETVRTYLSADLDRIAGGLALFVAVIHFFHPQIGFPQLIQYLQLGTLYDPRPLVFTISGLAIIVGVLLVYNGVARKRVYLLGIAMMITYLAGYVGWHTVLDHGTFWPYIEYPGHSEEGLLETIAAHLFVDPRELTSKAAELILLVLLVVLCQRERG